MKLTTHPLVFWFFRLCRDLLGTDETIIRDNARYVSDGDWHLWQDEGECVG